MRETTLAMIEAEIERLVKSRNILQGVGISVPTEKKARRKGLSEEGRKRISEGQRKRWALAKKGTERAIESGASSSSRNSSR